MPATPIAIPHTEAERRSVGQVTRRLVKLTPFKLVALAREHSDAAIRFLVSAMEDPDMPPPVRLRAAEVLLDRGWGKAAQSVSVDVKDSTPSGVLGLSIMERVAQLKAASNAPGTVDLEPSEAQIITDDPVDTNYERPEKNVTATAPAAENHEDLL